nr:uncharacterized protein LOC123759683 [Procambarus clarkii]XP_045600859.1 uncharacterized protein LOC123759683 [Procambarus clarkii]
MGGVWTGVTLLVVLAWAGVGVTGHGRLIDPPGRSTAWRYGFNTPQNYNDHEIYCGGYATQWQRNGGKCGPCGDPWHLPQPRDNEGGGKYGRGVIVKKYKHSSTVQLGVELTANHFGFFEFHLCPHNNPARPATDECLNKYILQKSDGTGPRYFPGPGAKKFYAKYRLPRGVTCTQCVLQWRYVAGNNWGKCENGTGMVGCGPQEEFRSCADITITEEDGSADDTPSTVPDYDDYNEVDVDTQEKPTLDAEEHVNHVGHIVALTLSFLLILLILVGLVAYFYWARDALKGFMKQKAGQWSKNAAPTPPTKQRNSVITISGPIGAPPVPPRRNRSTSGGSSVEANSREILSISSPTRVTINGIAVNSNNGGNSAAQARLHVPDD